MKAVGGAVRPHVKEDSPWQGFVVKRGNMFCFEVSAFWAYTRAQNLTTVFRTKTTRSREIGTYEIACPFLSLLQENILVERFRKRSCRQKALPLARARRVAGRGARGADPWRPGGARSARARAGAPRRQFKDFFNNSMTYLSNLKIFFMDSTTFSDDSC